MAPNAGGKATWPSNLQGRLSKRLHENIYAYTNAFLAVALELKAIQDGAGSHGPPKGLFQLFLDAVIELVGRFQEAPSVEDLTKDITELKSLVSKQTKDQLQLVKSVNALGTLRTGALTPVSGPPRSWLKAARRGAVLGTTTTITSGSYISNWLGAAHTKGSTVPSTVTRTLGSPAPVLPLTADLELHVRKTTPPVVNPFRHNYQKLVVVVVFILGSASSTPSAGKGPVPTAGPTVGAVRYRHVILYHMIENADSTSFLISPLYPTSLQCFVANNHFVSRTPLVRPYLPCVSVCMPGSYISTISSTSTPDSLVVGSVPRVIRPCHTPTAFDCMSEGTRLRVVRRGDCVVNTPELAEESCLQHKCDCPLRQAGCCRRDV